MADGAGLLGPPDDEASIRTIRRALEVGITTFDTAPAYGGGYSETILSVLWQPENYGKCLYAVERLRPFAAQPGVTTTLVGARVPDEIEDAAASASWALPDDVLTAVQAVSDELYLSMPIYPDMWGNWRTWNRRGPQREV